MTQCAEKPLVGVVMGSNSDWAVMQNAVSVLEEFGIAYEAKVVSAHRMPDEMFAYAESAKERGLACIIAGAGGAAHLPGMLAAKWRGRQERGGALFSNCVLTRAASLLI